MCVSFSPLGPYRVVGTQSNRNTAEPILEAQQHGWAGSGPWQGIAVRVSGYQRHLLNQFPSSPPLFSLCTMDSCGKAVAGTEIGFSTRARGLHV